jgi:hypothetical protein
MAPSPILTLPSVAPTFCAIQHEDSRSVIVLLLYNTVNENDPIGRRPRQANVVVLPVGFSPIARPSGRGPWRRPVPPGFRRCVSDRRRIPGDAVSLRAPPSVSGFDEGPVWRFRCLVAHVRGHAVAWVISIADFYNTVAVAGDGAAETVPAVESSHGPRYGPRLNARGSPGYHRVACRIFRRSVRDFAALRLLSERLFPSVSCGDALDARSAGGGL